MLTRPSLHTTTPQQTPKKPLGPTGIRINMPNISQQAENSRFVAYPQRTLTVLGPPPYTMRKPHEKKHFVVPFLVVLDRSHSGTRSRRIERGNGSRVVPHSHRRLSIDWGDCIVLAHPHLGVENWLDPRGKTCPSEIGIVWRYYSWRLVAHCTELVVDWYITHDCRKKWAHYSNAYCVRLGIWHIPL